MGPRCSNWIGVVRWMAALVVLPLAVHSAAMELSSAQPAGDDSSQNVQQEQVRLKLFDGKPKVFVVNGYSTSHSPDLGLFPDLNGWPELLQAKLDRHFDGKRVIKVVNATKGSTPIARWIDVNTGKPLSPWSERLGPALKGKHGRPVIVLAQQSLQWAFGERFVGIASVNDKPRIKQGADIIEKYVNQLKSDGADWVFISMHIYGAKGASSILEGEWHALDEFSQRKPVGVSRGPELWKTMKTHYPYAYAKDGRHPGKAGAYVMAHHWFRKLLEHDGLAVPDWSRKEMETAVKEARTEGK